MESRHSRCHCHCHVLLWRSINVVDNPHFLVTIPLSIFSSSRCRLTSSALHRILCDTIFLVSKYFIRHFSYISFSTLIPSPLPYFFLSLFQFFTFHLFTPFPSFDIFVLYHNYYYIIFQFGVFPLRTRIPFDTHVLCLSPSLCLFLSLSFFTSPYQASRNNTI